MSQPQFTLYSSAGPNGWKISYLLNELGIKYEAKYLNSLVGEHKKPEFLKINPNGRLPALIDHKNNDFTVWESAAILIYIVEKYDTKNRFNVTTDDDRHHLYQWLFFQMSGQGPYFGQAYWFAHLHEEKIPSAVTRYQNEIKRVLSVLESVLSKQEWLVGGKLTVADIAFVPYDNILDGLLAGTEFNFEKDFPATFKWHNKINALPGVKAGIEEQARVRAAAHK